MAGEVKLVAIDSLRARLRELLGDGSLVLHRLDRALAGRDPQAMEAAMRCLALHPPPLRQAVEEAMVRWLFDDGGAPLERTGGPAG